VVHVCPAEQFVRALNAGTRAMMANDGSDGTNAEVFAKRFLALIDAPADAIMPLFDAFYAHEFEALREHTAPDPLARPLVQLALAKGYQVAIATQPVFPLTAVLARLRWAEVGVETFTYDFVSSYETLGACKPHPCFFAALLDKLGREPAECLMVGDSLEMDMPARELGIKTYWVDRGKEQPCAVRWDARGGLAGLIDLIETGAIHDL